MTGDILTWLNYIYRLLFRHKKGSKKLIPHQKILVKQLPKINERGDLVLHQKGRGNLQYTKKIEMKEILRSYKRKILKG